MRRLSYPWNFFRVIQNAVRVPALMRYYPLLWAFGDVAAFESSILLLRNCSYVIVQVVTTNSLVKLDYVELYL